MLFHLSQISDLTQLNPHIPLVGFNPKEDNVTPRVCFAPTIGKCLQSIGSGLYECQTFQANNYTSNEPVVSSSSRRTMNTLTRSADILSIVNSQLFEYTDDYAGSECAYPVYHVYVPTDASYSEFYHPNICEVYDVDYTNEVWLTRPCAVEQVFSIIVIGQFRCDTVTLPTISGPHEYDIMEYAWHVIEPNRAQIYTDCIRRWEKMRSDLFFYSINKERPRT